MSPTAPLHKAKNERIVISWVLSPPTKGLLGGSWGDYQRLLHPRYYRKDGKLKWWAKLRLAKYLKTRPFPLWGKDGKGQILRVQKKERT